MVQIGFNPQDRFMMTLGNTLIVVTQSGDVFGADFVGDHLQSVFEFGGARIGFNPQDHFMMALGNTLVVVTESGDVFGADVVGRDLRPVFQFSGAKIGFNHPQDRFMMTLGDKLVVVRQEGDVFGSVAAGPNLGPVFRLNPPDVMTFDSGRLASDLPLGGSAHLVVQRNGSFTATGHMHDSGFDPIHYAWAAALVTPAGIAFTFEHQGHVEGTSSDLLGTPDRNDDFTLTGSDPRITAEWNGIVDAKFSAKIDGSDKLLGAVKEALGDALKQLGEAAVKAVVTLVVA
jgi:hypothetical protein